MATKPEFVIFYAWQSDRPGNGNRYLIQEAAVEAAARLTADAICPFAVRIDQDTQGVPGLCDIPATILTKIGAADAFVCDLTYVARSEANEDADDDFEPRYCSNPNVLFELGYAFRSIGPERVICVMNEHYGPVAEQIFDLAHRRFPITYQFPTTGKTRKDALNTLATKLIVAFTAMLPLGRRADAGAGDRIAESRRAFEERVRTGQFHGLIRRHGAIAVAVMAGPGTKLSHEDLQSQRIPTPGKFGYSSELRGNAVLSIGGNEKERLSITEARTDGVIFGAETWTLDPAYHSNKDLLAPSVSIESKIIGTTQTYLESLNKLHAPLPWTICISLLEVQNYYLFASVRQDHWKIFPEIDIRPEPIVVQHIDGLLDSQKVAQLLRPAIDFIWREFGFPASYSYTQDGVYNFRQ